MEYTTNLNLKKPDINEYYNIVEQENENADIIDEAIGKLNSDVGTEELTTEAQDCKGAINELNKNFTEFKLYNSIIINITSGIGTYTATRPLFCTIILIPNGTNTCAASVVSEEYGSVIAYLFSEKGANVSNSFFFNKGDTITVTANAEFSRIRVIATSFV